MAQVCDKSIYVQCLSFGWLYENGYFPINFNSVHWIVIILTIKIPCRFRWYGIIGPGGLIAASTAVIAFVYGYWDLDPIASLRFGEQLTTEQ